MKKQKKIKDRTLEEQKQFRDLITQELDNFSKIIYKKTGYYCQTFYNLLADDLRKTCDVDLDIALIERPHAANEHKVKHYLKANPDNVLDLPISVYQFHNWYKIFDGVHRTEANKRLGKKTIKAKIVIDTKDDNTEK